MRSIVLAALASMALATAPAFARDADRTPGAGSIALVHSPSSYSAQPLVVSCNPGLASCRRWISLRSRA